MGEGFLSAQERQEQRLQGQREQGEPRQRLTAAEGYLLGRARLTAFCAFPGEQECTASCSLKVLRPEIALLSSADSLASSFLLSLLPAQGHGWCCNALQNTLHSRSRHPSQHASRRRSSDRFFRERSPRPCTVLKRSVWRFLQRAQRSSLLASTMRHYRVERQASWSVSSALDGRVSSLSSRPRRGAPRSRRRPPTPSSACCRAFSRQLALCSLECALRIARCRVAVAVDEGPVRCFSYRAREQLWVRQCGGEIPAGSSREQREERHVCNTAPIVPSYGCTSDFKNF